MKNSSRYRRVGEEESFLFVRHENNEMCFSKNVHKSNKNRINPILINENGKAKTERIISFCYIIIRIIIG